MQSNTQQYKVTQCNTYKDRLDSVTQSGFEETNQQQHNSSNDHLSHDSSPEAA